MFLICAPIIIEGTNIFVLVFRGFVLSFFSFLLSISVCIACWRGVVIRIFSDES